MSDLSAVVAVNQLAGFTYDDARHVLYVTTATGLVDRWDAYAQSFLSAINVGGVLGGSDVSSDGAVLLVAQRDNYTYGGGLHARIERIDLATLGVEHLDVFAGDLEWSAADVAVVGDNTAFFTTNALPGYSGVDNPLRSFAASAPGFSPSVHPGLFGQSSQLFASEHGRYLLITEPNSSSAPLLLYDPEADAVVATQNVYSLGGYGFNVGKADISEDAGLVADVLYSNVYVLDLNLNLAHDFSSVQSNGLIVGAQFSGGGHQLFLWNSEFDSLIVYDTISWRNVGSIAVTSDVARYGGYNDAGIMELSGDGRLLFLDTPGGFEVIDLAARLAITNTGGAHNDVLYGAVGADTLSGAGGDDVLDGGGGDDSLDGGLGVDTASYAEAEAGVNVNLALQGSQQDTVGAGFDTLTGVENLIGSPFGDRLTGDAGDNRLNGGAGNDVLRGGLGTDVAVYADAPAGVNLDLSRKTAQDTGGGGVDVLSGIENLVGSAFGDKLKGDSGPNRLEGGDGVDSLKGGGGEDVLIGGAGHDLLVGAAGQDTFVLSLSDSAAAAPDSIADFAAGEKIDLSAIDADTHANGNQAFHLGQTAMHVGDIVVGYDAKHHITMIDLYVDNDAIADARILMNGDHRDLIADNFVL